MRDLANEISTEIDSGERKGGVEWLTSQNYSLSGERDITLRTSQARNYNQVSISVAGPDYAIRFGDD